MLIISIKHVTVHVTLCDMSPYNFGSGLLYFSFAIPQHSSSKIGNSHQLWEAGERKCLRCGRSNCSGQRVFEIISLLTYLLT